MTYSISGELFYKLPMLVYLNDRFVPEAEACVPVSDRGFRFGDGVFETIRIRRAGPWQWDFHLKRLQNGLAALRIPLDTAGLSALCARLIAENGMREGILRIMVSRGSGSLGYLPLPGIRPTLAIETAPLSKPHSHHIALWLSEMHKISPQSLPVRFKLAQGMQSALAKMEAADHDCFDSLLLDARGFVAETAAANIFWLKENALHTPSLDCGALEGSVRHAVIRHSPWRVEEGAYPLSNLRGADAVMLTNVAHGVLPVMALMPENRQWQSARAAELLNHAVGLA